jgi:hypothetical protein
MMENSSERRNSRYFCIFGTKMQEMRREPYHDERANQAVLGYTQVIVRLGGRCLAQHRDDGLSEKRHGVFFRTRSA